MTGFSINMIYKANGRTELYHITGQYTCQIFVDIHTIAGTANDFS